MVAPHTVHVGDWNHSLRETAPVPLKRANLSLLYIVTSYNPEHIVGMGLTIGKMKIFLCRFNLLEKANFARQMATMVDFATPKEAAKLKKVINGYVKKQIDFTRMVRNQRAEPYETLEVGL